MERDFGAPAVAMTVVSALPPFVAGFLGLVGVLVGMAGASLGLPPWIAPPGPVAAYLFVESAVRLASAVAAGEPMGALAIALVFAIFESARRSPVRRTAETAAASARAESPTGLRDRFHVLEPVLALLPRPDQERLARRYAFDPIRRGRATAVFLLAAALFNTAFAAAAFGAPGGFLGELVWSLPALYLVVEQIRRLQSLIRGVPAGSALGRLVLPFARPLLED